MPLFPHSFILSTLVLSTLKQDGGGRLVRIAALRVKCMMAAVAWLREPD